MRLLPTLAVIAAGALGTPAPAVVPAAATAPVRHYTVARVDTGGLGDLATDAEATAAATQAARFWRGVHGAPAVTFTVVHQTLHGTSTAPSCVMDVGRNALTAAGVTTAAGDGTVTFLRSGYPCFGDAGAHAGGDDVEVRGAFPGTEARTLAHEVGHTLGLQHDRTTGFLGLGLWEYGNPYSVMGSGDGPPAMWQAARLGWDRLYGVPTGRVYTVYPRTDARPGAVRGRAFTSVGVTYSVEARPAADLAPGGVAVYRSTPAGDQQWYATARPGHPVRAGASLIRVVAVRHGYWAIQRT